MRSFRLTLAVLPCLLALHACSDDPAGPDDAAFRAVIEVANPAGRPAPDVRVASMPVVPVSFWTPPEGGDPENPPAAAELEPPYPNPFN